MLKRKLEVFGKRLFVTGIVLGLFLAGCAGNPEVTSDAGAVEKEEVVDSKEGDVLQEQEVQEGKENSKESDILQETSDQEEDQDISDEASADDVLAAINSVKEETFTDEELQEIYSSIQEAVKREYLDPNGIEPKDFKWPKSFDLDGFDEDNAWLYFDYISAMYMSTGKFTADGFTADMPSEQNQQLMNAVLNGMIAWDQSSGNNDFGLIKIVLVPSGEKIPANVNFSD